jgi:NAD-dependent SIR2 family protein deacetylase
VIGMARTVKDLIDHMNKFKDAVVIIGPKAIDTLQESKPTIEEMQTIFTKKNLRRDPEVFWKFFKEKVFINPKENKATHTQEAVNTLVNLGVVKTVVDLNSDGLINISKQNLNYYIPLHGCNLVFKCQKCKVTYSWLSVFLDEEITQTECECCGGKLRPTTLMPGENYNDDDFHNTKEALFNTHTLLLVGINYGEQPIVDLIAKYGDMKATAGDNEEEKKMLVAVVEPDFDLDLNELSFFEFIVKDNIDDTLERLLKAFRE